MAKQFTREDVERIVYLHETEGLTHKEIAQRMERFDRNGAPNARAIMEQYARFKRYKSLSNVGESLQVTEVVQASVPMPLPNEPAPPPLLPDNVPLAPREESPKIERFTQGQNTVTLPKAQLPKPYDNGAVKIDQDVSLENMSRNQRFEYLKANLRASVRGKHTFTKILSEDEGELFIQEYFRIVKEQDTLTNAEEQQLFIATLSYVLMHRALELDRKAYQDYMNKTNGPASTYDTRWQKESAERNEQYQKGIESLKLSRAQRLKDLARSGNTFLDYVEVFQKKENQFSIADDIMRIESMTDAEVKRLQDNGWMIFGSSPNNNPEVNYGKEKVTTPDNTN